MPFRRSTGLRTLQAVTEYSLNDVSDADQVLWDLLDALRAGDEATVQRLLFPASARR